VKFNPQGHFHHR